MRRRIQRLDETILFSVHHKQTQKLSITMLAFSLVGNGGLLWTVIGAFLLLDQQRSRYGVYMLAALIFCALANNLLFKSFFERKRPCDTYQSIPLLIKRPIGSSFPSGHAATSFASATALMFMDVRIGLIALFVACVIAFSRLYLFVHYPSDIFMGAVSGTVIALISIQVVRMFFFFLPISYFAVHVPV